MKRACPSQSPPLSKLRRLVKHAVAKTAPVTGGLCILASMQHVGNDVTSSDVAAICVAAALSEGVACTVRAWRSRCKKRIPDAASSTDTEAPKEAELRYSTQEMQTIMDERDEQMRQIWSGSGRSDVQMEQAISDINDCCARSLDAAACPSPIKRLSSSSSVEPVAVPDPSAFDSAAGSANTSADEPFQHVIDGRSAASSVAGQGFFTGAVSKLRRRLTLSQCDPVPDGPVEENRGSLTFLAQEEEEGLEHVAPSASHHSSQIDSLPEVLDEPNGIPEHSDVALPQEVRSTPQRFPPRKSDLAVAEADEAAGVKCLANAQVDDETIVSKLRRRLTLSECNPVPSESVEEDADESRGTLIFVTNAPQEGHPAAVEEEIEPGMDVAEGDGEPIVSKLRSRLTLSQCEPVPDVTVEDSRGSYTILTKSPPAQPSTSTPPRRVTVSKSVQVTTQVTTQTVEESHESIVSKVRRRLTLSECDPVPEQEVEESRGSYIFLAKGDELNPDASLTARGQVPIQSAEARTSKASEADGGDGIMKKVVSGLVRRLSGDSSSRPPSRSQGEARATPVVVGSAATLPTVVASVVPPGQCRGGTLCKQLRRHASSCPEFALVMRRSTTCASSVAASPSRTMDSPKTPQREQAEAAPAQPFSCADEVVQDSPAVRGVKRSAAPSGSRQQKQRLVAIEVGESPQAVGGRAWDQFRKQRTPQLRAERPELFAGTGSNGRIMQALSAEWRQLSTSDRQRFA